MVAPDLSSLVRQYGWVDESSLRRLAAAAARDEVSLIQLLRDEGVAEDALADAVSRAFGTIVVDVDLGTLDSEAVRSLPESIARRFLLVPVARGERHLRVAFANPLDSAAFEVIRTFTSLEIEPLVGTVSGILAVLDREWRPNTEMLPIPGRSDLPAERTRPTEDGRRRRPTRDAWEEDWPSEASSEEVTQIGHASPHRLEREATPEQRHEALLLTLIEAGLLTRADYAAVLKRLLGASDEPQGR